MANNEDRTFHFANPVFIGESRIIHDDGKHMSRFLNGKLMETVAIDQEAELPDPLGVFRAMKRVSNHELRDR